MRREISRWRALANAAFVLIVLAIAVFGIVQVATRRWEWQQTFHARAEFSAIGGLETGDRVRVQGIDAGVVESIVPPSAPGKPVTLILRIDARLRPIVRSDATAKVVTQGVVGAKVVEIIPGRADAPALAESGSLRTEPPVELADLLKDARVSLKRLDEVTVAAREGLGEINDIAATIRQGKGSLGKFVKDDEAYNRMMSLSDRGERTLNDLDENLAALKRTWPLSRYFNDRAFFDRDRVLFQPGSSRQSRTLTADELFEPGRSVLTPKGRKKLDEVAGWFKKILKRNSEVVVASFTDDSRDEDLAVILTQEQANAVRKYLVTQHAVDSLGWFGTRKVAAVGFGTQVPRVADEPTTGMPPRRVEIIVFTPQA